MLDVRRVEAEGDFGAEPQDGVGARILKRGPAGATEDPTEGRKGPRPC